MEIKDNASLNNSTNQTRSGNDSLGIPNLFGKEKAIKASLPTTANLALEPNLFTSCNFFINKPFLCKLAPIFFKPTK